MVRIAFVGLIFISWAHTTRASFSQDQSIPALLDRYERREFETAREVVERAKDFEAFRKSFIRAAPRWITAAGPELVEKRRLRVAAFVLEVAWEFSDRRRLVDEFHLRWPPLRSLTEWACELVRSRAEPTDAERLWFRASFELGLRRDRIFVLGDSGKATRDRKVSVDREYGSAQDHLSHGLSRFPADPDFRMHRLEHSPMPLLSLGNSAASWLNRGISVAPARFQDIQTEAKAIRVRRRLPNAPRRLADENVVRRADFLTELLAMRSRIEPFAAVKEVRARVLLNLGLVAYCFADRTAALRHFAEIDDAADDIDLRFLGQFLVGFVSAQEGQVAASEAAYRSAHSLLPNAQSAIIGLSEILFTTGRRSEAAELAEWAIGAETSGHAAGYLADPWLQFKVLGRVQPSDVLSSLREAVAK